MTRYTPHTERHGSVPQDDWDQRVAACLQAIRDLDAREAQLHRDMISDVRVQLDAIGEGLS